MFTKLTDGKSFLVCGVVPRDAEFKTVGEKKSSLCEFSIKCDENEQTGEKTISWTSCKCWHSVAKAASKIKKLDVVLAMGRIVTEKWQDKSTGENKSKKVLECEFVSIMPGDNNSQTTAQRDAESSKSQNSKSVVAEMESAEDDYPF